jgi:AcrR family transcriptional regulator
MATVKPARPAQRARYEQRREDVVDRAARVFAREGYDQTSVPELAEALGIGTGSLYHYFPGKEALLIAICDQLMDPLLDAVEALLAKGGDPAEQLRSLIRLWVGHVIEHRDHLLVFQQERHVIDHGPQWRKVREDRKRFERLLDIALGRVIDAGRTVPVDRRLLLAGLLGMVNHTVQWYRPRGRLSPEEIADGYVDLVLSPQE